MLKGNKILQKLFFCFKLNPDNPDTANRIEEISDNALDALEKGAIVLTEATFAAINLTGKVSPYLTVPVKEYVEDLIHMAREKVDANIGNEGLQHPPHEVLVMGDGSSMPDISVTSPI